MLKSFYQFINEEDNQSSFINELATTLLNKIRAFHEESMEYTSVFDAEFDKPTLFNLSIKLRKDLHPNFKQDSHFNELPWEEINFSEKGYAIDANTYIDNTEFIVPKIIIHIIIDPNSESRLFPKLHARIIDILTHEITQMTQLGVDRTPFSEKASAKNDRKSAQKSYQYFLLKDEMEAMLHGIYARSKYSKIPVDVAIADYLAPFLKTRYITDAQYNRVMVECVKYALELYPDAIFSKKVEQIVNSI